MKHLTAASRRAIIAEIATSPAFQYALALHAYWESLPRCFVCPICSFEFRSALDWQAHSTLTHRDDSLSPIVYTSGDGSDSL